MSGSLTLHDHYVAFQAIQRDILNNSAASDANWKLTLISLRRDLQNRLGLMREALKACETRGADPERCRTLDHELSKLRSAIAGHQADWPAVIIDVENPAYKESLAKLRDVSAAFHRAAGELIPTLIR